MIRVNPKNELPIASLVPQGSFAQTATGLPLLSFSFIWMDGSDVIGLPQLAGLVVGPSMLEVLVSMWERARMD
jgi:hypothetical protein